LFGSWRPRAAARHSRAGDGVRDPIGQPPEVHEDVGEVITAALLPLLGRLVALRSPVAAD
jgi:protein-tyrosine phosphatase